MGDSNNGSGIDEIDVGVIEVTIIQFFILGVVLNLMSQLLTLGKNDLTVVSDVFTWTGSVLLLMATGLAYLFDHDIPLDPRSE